MNKKYGGMILVGIMALFVGLVISIQISTTQGVDQGGLVPSVKAKSYEAAMKKAMAEKDAAMTELNDLRDRVSEMEKAMADEDVSFNAMLSELEKYKMAAGMVDVKGPGVVVTLDDPIPVDGLEGTNNSILVYGTQEYLLKLVNRLKDGGAEAISVNEQRIISGTEISLAGNNLNINGEPTAPPYTIKAIGNPDTIASAITMRAGIVDSMKEDGLRVGISKQGEVEIKGYDGTLRYRYAQSTETEK